MSPIKFNLTYTISMGVEIVSLLARIGGCESDSYKYTYAQCVIRIFYLLGE